MGVFYDEASAVPQTVPVALNFILDCLPDAEGDFVKVYLYGLAHWTMQDGCTHEALAEALHMSPAEVQKAWSYWARAGLVALNKAEDGSYTVRFKQKSSKKAATPPPRTYTNPEMNAAMDQDRALRDMFTLVEEARGGEPLSPHFRQMLFRFYDQLKLPVEVIVLLVRYAVSSQKTSVRAIESLAARWVKEGITTYEKAEQFCRQKDEERQELKALSASLDPLQKLLGINPYTYHPEDQKKMATWLQLGFSPEMLALAKKVTEENIEGKEFVPGYMHSVLANWKKQGYTTPKDVENGKSSQKPKSRAAKKRSYELNEFERFAMEKKLQILEEKKGDSA